MIHNQLIKNLPRDLPEPSGGFLQLRWWAIECHDTEHDTSSLSLLEAKRALGALQFGSWACPAKASECCWHYGTLFSQTVECMAIERAYIWVGAYELDGKTQAPK